MIKCPGKNLERIVSCINSFRRHCMLAIIEPSLKETEEVIRKTFPKITRKIIKKYTKKAFQDLAKEYGKNNRIVYILSEYGDREEEIADNIKKHLEDCQKCREKYLLYLDKEAEKKLKWAHDEGMLDKKTKRRAQKVIVKGYQILVKEADILEFLPEDNLYKA